MMQNPIEKEKRQQGPKMEKPGHGHLALAPLTNTSHAVRTRWVDYAKHDYDAAQIEPGWHAWMSYMTHNPPPEDALTQTGLRKWEKSEPTPNLTGTRGAFATYST